MEGRLLLLIEPDSSSAAFMRHMLVRAGYEVEYAATGKEGLIAAWRDLPHIIVLELDLPDLDGLEVVRRLRTDSRTNRKQIVALTERSGAQASEAALEAGVNQYLVKQSDAIDMLLRTLADLRGETTGEDGTQPIGPGRVIAFMGAKGGVGTSSLCLNIAHALAESDESRTAVVDLVLPHGYLARITGETTPIDIVHLTAQVPAGKLTPGYLRANLNKPTSWGFHFVPGAKDPAQGAKLDADRLAPVVQTLRASFDRIIIDLGRTLSALTLLVLRQTDVAVMVFSPEAGVVQSTQVVLRYLVANGIPSKRFFLLSNRPLGNEDMTAEELTNALGAEPDAAVPYLGSHMALANRLHAPHVLRFPQETGSHRFAEVARMLHSRQMELQESAQ